MAKAKPMTTEERERISSFRLKAEAANNVDDAMICSWALDGNVDALRIALELVALDMVAA